MGNREALDFEIYYRCKQHYEFLMKLEQESLDFPKQEPIHCSEPEPMPEPTPLPTHNSEPTPELIPNVNIPNSTNSIKALLEIMKNIAIHIRFFTLGMRNI
jgi:hypothetical protein